MKLAWEPWIYGLLSGFIGGGASSLVAGSASVYLAPETFNSTHPGKVLTLVGVTFLFNGIQAAVLYLKQSPLPAVETTTTTTTVQQQPAAVVVKTVETKETK